MYFLEKLEKLKETCRSFRPAADIEGLSFYLRHQLAGEEECIHQVFNEKQVADLTPVAIETYGIVAQGPDGEMGNPAWSSVPN